MQAPPSLNPAHTIRLLLGDQLNAAHSWWKQADDGVVTVMMECRQETDYARHHVQKVLAFSWPCANLPKPAWGRGTVSTTSRFTLRVLQNSMMEVLEGLRSCGAQTVCFQAPDEWRLDELIRGCQDAWPHKLGVEVVVAVTEHFLTGRGDLKEHFQGKKQYLMESFYRMMRKRHDVLLDGAGQPEGGKWNYDANNRKKLPKGHVPPAPRLWNATCQACWRSWRARVSKRWDGSKPRALGGRSRVRKAWSCSTCSSRSCCRGLGTFKTH